LNWATAWAISPQTHLVTLLPAKHTQRNSSELNFLHELNERNAESKKQAAAMLAGLIGLTAWHRLCGINVGIAVIHSISLFYFYFSLPLFSLSLSLSLSLPLFSLFSFSVSFCSLSLSLCFISFYFYLPLFICLSLFNIAVIFD
jgi:hypothetical protein